MAASAGHPGGARLFAASTPVLDGPGKPAMTLSGKICMAAQLGKKFASWFHDDGLCADLPAEESPHAIGRIWVWRPETTVRRIASLTYAS